MWLANRLPQLASSDLAGARAARLRTQLHKTGLPPQTICEAAASVLDANAIVVERMPNDYVVVACSPWKPDLVALDRIALDLCFRTASFAGAGAARSGGSDWLFVPITVREP